MIPDHWPSHLRRIHEEAEILEHIKQEREEYWATVRALEETPAPDNCVERITVQRGIQGGRDR